MQTTSVLQSLGVVYNLQINKTVLYLHQSDIKQSYTCIKVIQERLTNIKRLKTLKALISNDGLNE